VRGEGVSSVDGRRRQQALGVRAVVEAVLEGYSTAEEEEVVVVVVMLLPWRNSLAGHRRMEGQSTVVGKRRGLTIVESVS